MNRKQMITGLLVLALLFSMASSMVVQADGHKAAVEPYIWQALDRQGQATVIVILNEQANLEGAAALQRKAEKGAFVYEQLVQVAERTQPSLRGYLDRLDVDYQAYWIRNMLMLDVDADLLQRLARRPEVDRIEYYYPAIPDPVVDEKEAAAPSAVEWNIMRVNADDVWGLGITGAGAVVADLDTGVDWDHPALIDAYRPQIPGAPGRHDYNWWDGPSGSQVPIDYDNHGTHTMGTIVGDDGGGNQIGMAPGAQWIACAGLGSSATPFDCFQFFLAPTQLDGSNPRPDLAPHVINNSWSSQTDYRDVIHTLYLAGIYYAKSAGNEGAGCSTITNPGQWPEVTATASFAQGDVISTFSSRGPVVVDRETVVKPDIAAPGSNVRSSLPGGGYGNMNGTSMACPHVTGAVALLISANPELAGQIDALQHLLKSTAEPMISGQCPPFVDHPNDVWGWGILNIYDAVVAAQAMGFGQLQGTVYEEAGGTPLENAQIDLQEQGTPWSWLPKYSAPNGFYSYTLPAATYHITASLYGYLPESAIVTIPDDLTISQDLSLTTAPYWVISGTILEEGTLAPLAGSLTLEGTPVVIHSDPADGTYNEAIAQGSYWTLVRSPGHAGQDVLMDYYDHQTVDWLFTPVHNYYMRTSDEPCGPTFEWVDATDGTQICLGDDSYQYYNLGGPSFSFYGNDYSVLYIGSNGLITFGGGWNKWSGPIPDPTAPNNGIYAFATDLNPNSCAQGSIYRKWVDNTLVIEFYQVEHYPDGDPETFEILLDTVSGAITLQYLTVSDSSECVAGVENSDGTEATQYAYADPLYPHDNLAVAFYPMFSTPPGEQGAGTLTGTVYDSGSMAPIADATIQALSYGGLFPFSATTDISGNYSLPLCADYYSVSASAAGYLPGEEAFVEIVSGTTTPQDFYLEQPPPCEPVVGADFGWDPILPTVDDIVSFTATAWAAGAGAWITQTVDSSGRVGMSYHERLNEDLRYAYTSDASPTPPISYTWDLGDGSAAEGQFVQHGYDQTGVYTVVMTATNCGTATATAIQSITVTEPCTPVTSTDFDWTPITPTVGQTVTLAAWADGDPAPGFDWDLGDGTLGGGMTVTHAYTQAGAYTVHLLASNACGWAAMSHTLSVIEPCTPVTSADFDWTPLTPTVGQTVTLAAWADGDPAPGFDWDLGDGTLGGGMTVTHAYTQAGAYTVHLLASNACGWAAMSHTLSVVEPCTPVEIVTVTYSAESCQVSLSAELTGTAPFTWLWDMGTLGTSTETHPLFDLGQTGTYTGTLEAWNCGEDGYAVHTFSVDVFCTTEYKIYLPLLFKGAEN